MEQQGKKTSQWALLKRVLGYTLKQYKFCWLTVVVCIFITAMTTLVSNLFMQSLIDDYILPLAQAAAPDFGPLAGALLKLAAVLLAGISTAVAGAVSFLGLIVPHIGRLLVGSDHRALIPFSMLAGAFTFLLADTIGRTIAAPYEVSASIIMSVAGGPFFIILLRRSKKYAA